MLGVAAWILVGILLVLAGALLAFSEVFSLAVIGSAAGMLGLLMLLFGAAVVVALLVRGVFSRRPDEPREGRLT